MTSPHDRHPDELLPWYVNETLTGEELRTVEEHLPNCERCRHELEWLQLLRAQVKRTDVGEIPSALGRARLLRDLRGGTTQSVRRRAWWQPALAAAAMVMVIQAAALFHFWSVSGPITPLGGPHAQEAILQVRFAPSATEAELRAVLQEIGGVLVDGPGALGVYRVRLEGDKAPAAIGRAVDTLRSKPNIVWYVAAD